jgi:acyl dehydratase
MTEASAAQLKMTAFLGNEDSPTIRNAIHSTQGAKEYGYKAALVGGATVFGWATPLIIEVLGQGWLDRGWAELAFRRPTYPGDEITIAVEGGPQAATVSITGEDGAVRIAGDLGCGIAPWLDDVLLRTPMRAPEPAMEVHPRLTHEIAPVGRELAVLGRVDTIEDVHEYASRKQRSEDPLFVGDRPRLHPGWLVNRPTSTLHHSFDYGPAIHVRTHLQIFEPVYAGEPLVTTATFRETYERKGHHYGAYDCTTYSEEGRELVRQRHTTIYEVAKRPTE